MTLREPERGRGAPSLFDAPVLRGLDARAQRELDAASTRQRLTSGQRLYAQGERADSFFVVLDGSVELAAKRREGAEASLVRRAIVGESFGEEATVTGRRHADAYGGARGAEVVKIPVHLFRRAAVRSGRAELADRLERTLQRAAARDAIAGTPLAQSLDEDGLESVLDAVTFHTFARGQTIYRQGDASVALFVVGDGLVQIQTEEDERVRVRAYLARGDFFGDEELETATPRAASAVANGPSVVLTIPARVVRTIASRDADLFSRLSRVALGVGARQQAIVAREVKNATQHVFRDLYRVQVARSLLVIDLETCVRCGQCSWACGSLYGESRLIRRGDKVVTRGLGAVPESADAMIEGAPRALLMPSSCQHCENPACMVDCPTGAIGKDASGEVFIREELCTGCGACARACPWTNIQMAPRPKDAPKPAGVPAELLATKCDLCRTYERGPACVQVCPTGAILRVDPQKDWAEVALLLGSPSAAAKPSTAGHKVRSRWPIWSPVLGATLAAAAIALVGAVMRSRGLWSPWRGQGYAAGWAAGSTMLALAAYTVPKRLVRVWMRLGGRRKPSGAEDGARARDVVSVTRPQYIAHLVLGLLAMGFAIAHAPHSSPLSASRGAALLVALYIAGLSGVLMGLLYWLVPPALSRIERTPLLPEDFATERAALSARLYKNLSGRDELVKVVASKVLLPYAKNPIGGLLLVASGRDLKAEERTVRRRIDAVLEGRGQARLTGLDDLVRIAVELRALPAQHVLARSLRVLLPVHVVAFTVALVLLVLHVAGAVGASR